MLRSNTIFRVAIFPSGSEIGLEIYQSLNLNKQFELIGLNSDISNHSEYLFDEYYVVPDIYSDGFATSLVETIKVYKIDLIIPALENVQLALLNTNDSSIIDKLVSPSKATVDLCVNKDRCYEKFKDYNFTPIVYQTRESVDKFPVFAKPKVGYGSRDVHIVKDQEQLSKIDFCQNVVTEYLPGEELTVDCCSSFEGELIYCAPRSRNRIRGGIAVNTFPVEMTSEVEEIASSINQTLEMRGGWFFQLKRGINSSFKLLEIGPRTAGSMTYSRLLGVNIPLLSIYTHLNIPIEILKNNYFEYSVDKALYAQVKLKLNFDDVYVDYDDTLIVHEKINCDLLAILFRFFNNGKRLILITKHKHNIFTELKKRRLSGIFDEIIHLRKDEDKSNFMTSKNSIFIDDSFQERKDIHSKLGIPTFDTSMMEVLKNA